MLPKHIKPDRQIAYQTQGARAEANGVSTRTQKKLDALARRAPDMLERVKAGEMSVHAAAIEAGIVKEKTTFEKLTLLWAKATRDEREAFLVSVKL